MSKILIIALISACISGVGSFFGGVKVGSKATRDAIVPCPACNCPPATEVHLADFDVEKINNRKGTFNYNPTLTNVRVIIEAKDSTLIKQLLKGGK